MKRRSRCNSLLVKVVKIKVNVQPAFEKPWGSCYYFGLTKIVPKSHNLDDEIVFREFCESSLVLHSIQINGNGFVRQYAIAGIQYFDTILLLFVYHKK